MHPTDHGPPGQPAPYAPYAGNDFRELPLAYQGGSRPPETGCREGGTGRFASLKRFFLWWLGFAGIYAGASVCPFCGQPTCPVGPGAAGLIGALFAALLHYGRRIKAYFRKIRDHLRE